MVIFVYNALILSCNCRCGPDPWMEVGNSTCSHDATLRGSRQLVVSVSASTLTPTLMKTLAYFINQVNVRDMPVLVNTFDESFISRTFSIRPRAQ